MKPGLRERIALIYASALTLALVVFCAAIYFFARAELMKTLDRELSDKLQEVSAVLAEEPGIADGKVDRQALARRLPAEMRGISSGGYMVRVLSGAGQPAFEAGPAGAGVPAALPRPEEVAGPIFRTVHLPDDGMVRLAEIPYPREQPLVYVQVARRLKGFLHELHEFGEFLLVAAPLVLLISIGGGLLLARGVLRPIEGIARTVHRITETDLSRRVPLSGRSDELDHLAGQINGMLERLESSVLRMRQFTSDAAHELRTPLTAMRSEVELALSRQRSADDYRKTLGQVAEEIERLGTLVEQLLFLARIGQAGERGPGAELLDMAEVALEVCDMMRVLAETKNVDLRLNLAPSPIHGLRSDVARITANLVDNAVRHTPDGGHVEIRTWTDGESCFLQVADSGEGMTPEIRSRVFDRFYVADGQRSSGRTGLGLSMVQSLVNMHGGTVAVDSSPGKGSTFKVSIPHPVQSEPETKD